MFTLMPRILVSPYVPPRPAIESTFLHMRDVIGGKVIAESVALIHREPQLAGLRIYRNPSSGVANAVGIHAQLAVCRIAHQYVGTIFLLPSSIGIIHVRGRTDRDKHFLSILGEGHGARPMSAWRG